VGYGYFVGFANWLIGDNSAAGNPGSPAAINELINAFGA
jgi:hypothetical protein